MSVGFDFVLGSLLAQGSAPPEMIDLTSQFDVLVLCAWEYQPPKESFRGVHVIRVCLDDSGIPPTESELQAAVAAGREVAAQLRKGRRVLVTCYKGWNRSGIVTAIALIELGLSPRAAIYNVRRARGPRALSNRYFVQALRQYRSQSSAASVSIPR